MKASSRKMAQWVKTLACKHWDLSYRSGGAHLGLGVRRQMGPRDSLASQPN